MNFLFLEGQARSGSSGIDAAGIWYLVFLILVFLSFWFDKTLLCENMWWGRYTGDSLEVLKIGAAVVALTRQQTTNVQE